MSEYILNDCIIDRCHVCNNIWLDQGEFEKVLIAMPDVRKQWTANQKDLEKQEIQARVTAAVREQAIEETKRKMADRAWNKLSFLFYD